MEQNRRDTSSGENSSADNTTFHFCHITPHTTRSLSLSRVSSINFNKIVYFLFLIHYKHANCELLLTPFAPIARE